MVIQTERLLIRPYEKMDEAAVYNVINSKGIFLTTISIPYPYPREQVGIWLEFVRKNRLYQRGYEYGIFTHEGIYIGNIGIVNIDRLHRNGEITYFIGEDYWGKGYATEATKAMLGFAFKTLELERIQGRCMKHNIASFRVMQKCYFQYEGLARHEVLKCGEYQDVYHTAILKKDYFDNL